jgi:hypothetical protein
MNFSEWLWSEEHRQLCKVIETQTLWGNTFHRIWLPNQDTVVRVRADTLKPPSVAGITTPAGIAYIATSARIADALTQDVLLAPIESAAIPLPHQIKALSKAVSSNSVRYLLADEVGLGKTIEAGLIMRELKLRGMVRRILIVAPKGLVSQWVSEMRLHFNEEFQLLLPEDIKTLQRLYTNPENQNPWNRFNQVVCPMDSVKPMDKRRGWTREQLAEYNRDRFEDLIAAAWDLVIVDEAHRLGGSTDQVARYKLGQGLSEAAPYLLLLSATPHQGKTDAFYRLISLLDPPIPHWVERMTINYLRSHGGIAEKQSDTWNLTLPTGEQLKNAVFNVTEATAAANAQHLTLEDSRIRGMVMAKQVFAEGQPIPYLSIPSLPADVQGFWSLWRIAIYTEDWNQQRMMPLFLNDDGRVFLPTARYIWEQLLTEEVEIQKHLCGEEATKAFGIVWETALVQGKGIYEELLRKHHQQLEKEREKNMYAFAARRRAIERIGLPQVRDYRLTQLTQEEQTWREAMQQKSEVTPELIPLLLMRVENYL